MKFHPHSTLDNFHRLPQACIKLFLGSKFTLSCFKVLVFMLENLCSYTPMTEWKRVNT